jgi:hypothetical protein
MRQWLSLAMSRHSAANPNVATINKPAFTRGLHDSRIDQEAQAPSQEHIRHPVPSIASRHSEPDDPSRVHELRWASI